ncbi:MAG: polysaccharide polymerase [Acetobacter aceti]|uniref:polysaccharide polymerase n=1 Tax=Acetobacter aceti TaxID=435 RepID=UPI0011EA5A32|nr:polysaccharide polymerase [Acetobacter aceti]
MSVAVSQPPEFAGIPVFQREIVASSRFVAGKWLVIAAIMFNPLLCFLDTKGLLHASSGVVALAELIIIFAGTWYVRQQMQTLAITLALIISAYVVGAHLINSTVSLKILHDLWIPYVFYLLGTLSSLKTAKTTVWISIVFVLFFGFFELLAFNVYGQFFNVWQYYVDKGALGTNVINYQNTTSFLSGNRAADARTYFPSLLGSARISSVFLEPVSLGNYATILFAWGLSLWKKGSGSEMLVILALGFLCIILGDSRFATGCCFLMVMLRFTPLVRSSLFVIGLPVLVMTILTVVGSTHEIPGVHPGILSDDFKGRLLFSGRLLDDWSLASWFGLAPSPVYTADTGYAYLCNNLGVLLTVTLWILIAFHRNSSPEAAIMKTMLAVYFSTSLCIGANAVTIKTGALLWFLYGALDASSRNSLFPGASALSVPRETRAG